ncbi:transmembrane protein 6/97 [Lenzites betulinus]|nr:transmembrane protein 6/97 [Lenzites betulinus]
MARIPLAQRPRDLVYFLFFAIHLPATFLIDLQALYPKEWVPSVISNLAKFYVEMSADPLIGSSLGYFGQAQVDAYTWFRTLLVLEAFFQVPVFVLGLRGLWKGSRSIYVLLLIYASSAATTTLPCLSVILSTPISLTPLTIPSAAAQTSATVALSLTAEQRLLLLSSYIPFFLVPFVMAVDMALRVQGIASARREPKVSKQD